MKEIQQQAGHSSLPRATSILMNTEGNLSPTGGDSNQDLPARRPARVVPVFRDRPNNPSDAQSEENLGTMRIETGQLTSDDALRSKEANFFDDSPSTDDAVSPTGARLSGSNSEVKSPAQQLSSSLSSRSDFSFSDVTGSYRREKSIEGLFFGIAIGDALGLARVGLCRRTAIRMFGRSNLDYQFCPFAGLVSNSTLRMLITVQAVLRSRSQSDIFRKRLANRLRAYLWSIPTTACRATWLAMLRLNLGMSPLHSGVHSNGSGPLASSLALSTVLQGTGHSVERWIEASTDITHIDPLIFDASILIAQAGHLALMRGPDDLVPIDALDVLIRNSTDDSLRNELTSLREPLQSGWSVHRAARKLGWDRSVPNQANAIVVIAIYAWLRHPHSFRRAVESAIRCGGDTNDLGALTGGYLAFISA